MKNIAWIGTGFMGKPMANHLADGGHKVVVYNRSLAKTSGMNKTIEIAKTIKACVNKADVVFTMVGYPSDVDQVYKEVFKYAKAGAILIDMTTSSPKLARTLAKSAAAKGFKMIDAPVTGGAIGAQNASLSIMFGGDEPTFKAVKPLLSLLGTKIILMGKAGSGQDAKLANQIAVAGNIIAITEALSFAKLKKLNLNHMLEIINNGAGGSWQSSNTAPKMISKDFTPTFLVKHFVKDLGLVLDEKEALKLPVVQQVFKIYAALEKAKLGEMGIQVSIEYYLQNM
jgi:3-hydroxyisobutyrate dehydrogenase-like beta-hydroxyacid dehydrogenase